MSALRSLQITLRALAVFGSQRKHPTKSLEELAIIVEVLEEDLRTSNTYRSPTHSLSSSYPAVSPERSPTGNSWGPHPNLLLKV